MTDCQPWYTIVFYNSSSAEYRAGICDEPSHEKNANVREDDCIALTRVEENGRCCERVVRIRHHGGGKAQHTIKMISPFGVCFLS